MPATVREARLDDLETLVAFTLAEAVDAEQRSLDADTVRRGVAAALTDPDIAMYWVLEDADGSAVGSISVVREWSNWQAGYYWWIQSLYIRPEARGQGLMRDLVAAVVVEARRQGALDLRLYAHRDNARARHAYVREGFEEAPYVLMAMRLGC
jgi:GNAT superfamily N-acetyltransferase